MAGAGEEFYRDVVRAGYRGRYLRALAAAVAAGEVDLEALPESDPLRCRMTRWRNSSWRCPASDPTRPPTS